MTAHLHLMAGLMGQVSSDVLSINAIPPPETGDREKEISFEDFLAKAQTECAAVGFLQQHLQDMSTPLQNAHSASMTSVSATDDNGKPLSYYADSLLLPLNPGNREEHLRQNDGITGRIHITAGKHAADGADRLPAAELLFLPEDEKAGGEALVQKFPFSDYEKKLGTSTAGGNQQAHAPPLLLEPVRGDSAGEWVLHHPKPEMLPAAPAPAGETQAASANSPLVRVMQIDTDFLTDQLVQGIRFARHGEVTELQVHVKPEFLGKLSIKIVSDLDGIQMEIRAENEMVRQIVQDSLVDLHNRLADKGIVLDHFALLADSGWTPRRKPEKAVQPELLWLNGEKATPSEVVAEWKSPAHLSLIDYVA